MKRSCATPALRTERRLPDGSAELAQKRMTTKMQVKKNVLCGVGAVVAVATIASAQMTSRSMNKMQGDMMPLSDAQIAHIAVTADEIDIAYAHLALAFSANPDVRQFAETMIADHSAVNAKAAALAEKLGLTPQDNEVSQKLMAQAKVKMDELSEKRGEAFDRAYVANELAYHEAVNAAVRDTLVPGAENPELKKLLQSAVPLFLAHEDHVRRLHDAIHGDM